MQRATVYRRFHLTGNTPSTGSYIHKFNFYGEMNKQRTRGQNNGASEYMRTLLKTKER